MRFDFETFQFTPETDPFDFSDEWWVMWEKMTGADTILIDARDRLKYFGARHLNKKIQDMTALNRAKMTSWLNSFIIGISPEDLEQPIDSEFSTIPQDVFYMNFALFQLFWNCGGDCALCVVLDSSQREKLAVALDEGRHSFNTLVTSILREAALAILVDAREQLGYIPTGSAGAFAAVISQPNITDSDTMAVELDWMWGSAGVQKGEA